MNQQNKSDILEIFIILAMFLLIVVIYVPVAIWEEESYYEKESRYRMQNVYDVQSFYSRLTGEYTPSFFEALNVVNSVRDSTIADSLYLGEQNLVIGGQKYLIDVNQSYGLNLIPLSVLKVLGKTLWWIQLCKLVCSLKIWVEKILLLFKKKSFTTMRIHQTLQALLMKRLLIEFKL